MKTCPVNPRLLAAALLLSAACSAGNNAASTAPAVDPAGKNPGGNAISGSIQGVAWNALPAVYWIGMPSAAPPVTFVFLLERPTECAALSHSNWDKIIGDEQVLEIQLTDRGPRTFQITQDAAAAYLRGNYNPNADSGSVTITDVAPNSSLTGTFHTSFQGDTLTGSFHATYCPEGVEP